MKRLIYITLALLSICGCVEETPTVTLGSVSSSNFDGTTVKLTGEAQSFDVTLDGNGWRYASPSADTWIICEKTSESTLTVYVTRNTGSASRTSHFLVYAGKETVSIQVEQDYWRYFTFYSEDNLIAPSAGEYKIPASTNLTAEEMTLSASEDWVSGLHVADGWLYFTVSANASGAARPATLSISSELVNESAKITQGVGAAKAVIMSSISLDLDTYPVYEARNPEDNSLVGLVCKEYLFKLGENGTAEVDGSYTVIYPILDGEPDYTRGTILQNGGRVIWNTKTTTATPGNEMIARIEIGSAEASLLAWLPTGEVDLVTTEPTEEEANAAVIATYTPMIVKDTRKGEADSRENTEETFEYAVVKIGLQFWMKSNFAAARFNNGEPIPTGFTNDEWSANISPVMGPMCLVSGTGSSTTFIDANDPAGYAARVKYGCLYDYAAIVGQTLVIPTSGRISYEKKDMLAPEGWGVPYKSDFTQLLNYVVQKDIRETGPEDYSAEMIDKMSSSKSNVTGFSAMGSRGRANTGLYGSLLYYLTIDYTYSMGSHTVATIRFQSGSYEPIYDLTFLYGAYVRLIKR